MGDDHDGVVFLQFVDQLLDLRGRDRVERRARLVEQDHLGPHRHGAGDAQPLLLSAGETEAAGAELVLDLVPQRGAAQRVLDALVELALRQLLVEPDAEGDVLVDRHRKRRRLLEHHADAGPQQVEIDTRIDDVEAVELHLSFGVLVRIKVVHPVEHPQQRRLPAARRADEGRHLVLVERQGDALQRPGLAVEELEIADRHLVAQARRIDRRMMGGGGGQRGGRDRRRDGHDDFLVPASARAMMLSASTEMVMMSAPVHASFCQSS